MLTAIPATLMRGGTSKALYFHAAHLPTDRSAVEEILLAAMGSPHERQIDGVGGAHPLTSKVAIVGPASRPDADVDYLFLQVGIDAPTVSDAQNCGNILAGVGPWAIENGLVRVAGPVTAVRIHMVNTGGIAIAHVPCPDGRVAYEGDVAIDGVPGVGAAIVIEFPGSAGSSCGALLPTGSPRDHVEGLDVTCIDAGMPVVILPAEQVGKSGRESPAELEADAALSERLEHLRVTLGPRMNLGDVKGKTVPKICLVSPPVAGGTLATRTFIPHRVHDAIGVLGAVSVAAACSIPGTVASGVCVPALEAGSHRVIVEHPSGRLAVDVTVAESEAGPQLQRVGVVRTARKLMGGEVYVPRRIWSPT